MTELETKVINEKIDFINQYKRIFIDYNCVDDIEYKLYKPLDDIGYQEYIVLHKNGGTRSIDVTKNNKWSIAIEIINAVCM